MTLLEFKEAVEEMEILEDSCSRKTRVSIQEQEKEK